MIFLCLLLYIGVTSSGFIETSVGNIDTDVREMDIPASLRNRRNSPEQMQQWYLQLVDMKKSTMLMVERDLDIILEKYIPENSYLVLGSVHMADRAAKHPFVQWVGLRRGIHKRSQRLLPSIQFRDWDNSTTTTTATTTSSRSRSNEEEQEKSNRVILLVSLFEPGKTFGANDLSILKVREFWEGEMPAKIDAVVGSKVQISCEDESCAHDAIVWLSERPEVLWVEEKSKLKTRNFFGGKILIEGWQSMTDFANISSQRNNSLYSAGLTGTGQIVGVSDTGIDFDNCYFFDPKMKTPPLNRVDYSARKIVGYYYYNGSVCGLTNRACGDALDDVVGHGTHVVASIVGNVLLSSTTPTYYPEFAAFNGIAYDSKVVFTDIEVVNDGDLNIPLDLNTALFPDAYKAGARVYSLSWGCYDDGSITCNDYLTMDMEIDQFSWDHKDMLVVVAVGNSGNLAVLQSSDSPSNAKNVMAVGATQNYPQAAQRSALYMNPSDYLCDESDPTRPNCCFSSPHSCVRLQCCTSSPVLPCCSSFPAYQNLAPDNLASFSSRGYTMSNGQIEGRIKPDVVAPGTSIVSANSDGVVTDSAQCVPASSDSQMFRSATALNTMDGTSMATPLVAALCLLVRQFFVDGFYPKGFPNAINSIKPSASLVKAVIISSAHHLTGNVELQQLYKGSTTFSLDSTPGPNPWVGFGLPILSNLLLKKNSTNLWIHDNDNGLLTGEICTYQVNNIPAATTFRITLVWTDFPGTPGVTRQLVNDLDLSLTAPGNVTVYPNRLLTADRVNNVERIDFYNSGDRSVNATINVYGYRVANVGVYRAQDYSLVATGHFDTVVLVDRPFDISKAGASGPQFSVFVFLIAGSIAFAILVLS